MTVSNEIKFFDLLSQIESTTLIRLREAYLGLASGQIESLQYQAIIEDVLTLVASAIDLYTCDDMQAGIAAMEPGLAKSYRRMASAANDMETGLLMMQLHANPAQVQAGLKKVEEGLLKVEPQVQ